MKKITFSCMTLILFGQQLCAMEDQHALVAHARNGQSHEVKKILQCEPVSQKDKDRALEYATVHADRRLQPHGNYYSTIDSLLKAGADVNTALGRPLRSVAGMGNEDILELLLEEPGINLNARGAFGETGLTEAVKHGKTKIFARLVVAGASLTQRKKDLLLIQAARGGHEDLVNILIGMGSDIRSRAYVGEVEGEACRLARYYKHTNIVNIFTRLYGSSNAPTASKVVVSHKDEVVGELAEHAQQLYGNGYGVDMNNANDLQGEWSWLDGDIGYDNPKYWFITHPNEINPIPNFTMRSNVATKSTDTFSEQDDWSMLDSADSEFSFEHVEYDFEHKDMQ